jgi:hypothetical protein
MTADQLHVGQIFRLRFDNIDGWQTVKIVAAVEQMEPPPFQNWNVQKGDGAFSETREISAETLLAEADYVEG